MTDQKKIAAIFNDFMALYRGTSQIGIQEICKKEKEQKKRISKQKKSVQQNGKKKTSVKTSPTIPAKNSAPAPAKKKKEENIQLSMFDMMQLDNE